MNTKLIHKHKRKTNTEKTNLKRPFLAGGRFYVQLIVL